MKKKLLLTAQDYSSGINILPLYANDRLRSHFDLEVMVSGPSCALFPPQKDVNYLSNFQEDLKPQGENLKNFLQRHLDRLKPDIVMSGISGFNFGIDEMSILLCKGHIKTFSYQDYWGHVNQALDVVADHMLVLDDFAKDLTLSILPFLTVTTVGSMKYSYYEIIAETTIAPAINKARFITEGKDYWIFAGQPLWNLKAYQQTLLLVLEAAQQSGHLLFYLPHPRESEDCFDHALQEIVFYPERHGVCREAFVLNASKVISCFSTLSFDIIILKKILDLQGPDVAVLFLFDEIVACHYQHSGGLKTFPLGDKGVYQVECLKDFQNFLKYKAIEKSRSLTMYKNAANNIISQLIGE